MRTRKSKAIFTLALILSLNICVGQGRITDNSVSIEIPVDSDGEYNLFYKLANQKSKQLKINHLERGVDSIEIRIWYQYSLINKEELIVLKYEKSRWIGFHYDLEVEWNAFKLTDKIKKSKRTQIIPRSGWDQLIEILVDKQILSLPNMNDIEGLRDNWSDGTTFSFEVGTKDEYRFYNYHLPKKFVEYWQAQNVVDILDLIEEEFELP